VQEEFTKLINQHKGIIHKVCNVFFYQHPYKEDYVQEIVIQLWKSYPTFSHLSKFSTWMYRVALNTAIDIKRKEILSPKLMALSAREFNLSDSERNESNDERDQLYSAISRFPDIEKVVILLYLEDYSYKEIAEIMGISESLTGVKINRIKNRLIKILNHGK